MIRDAVSAIGLSMVSVIIALLSIAGEADAQSQTEYCHPYKDRYAPLNLVYHQNKVRQFAGGQPDRGTGIYICSDMVPKPIYDEFFIIRLGFEVAVKGPLCVDNPQLVFASRNMSAAGFFSQGNHQNTLKLLERIYEVLRVQCGRNTGVFRVDVQTRDYSQQEPTYRSVYKGDLISYSQGVFSWRDDDPKQRFEYAKAKREARLAAMQKNMEQQRQRREFWTSLGVASIGYIQGVAFEFADEGVCGFFAAALENDQIIDQSMYTSCHNHLNNTLEQLKDNHLEAYVVGNLLGAMNTSFNDFIEDGKDTKNRLARKAAVECVEMVVTGIGAGRIGERLSDQAWLDYCLLGAQVGAASSLIGR